MPIFQANSDTQLAAIRSNSDIVIMTGAGGSGKSFAVAKALDECLTIPSYSAIVFLKNIADFSKEGSLLSQFLELYPIKREKDKGKARQSYIGTMTTSSDNMKISFINGSSISFMHLADERKIVIDERAKSIQVDKILFDECQRFQWYTISAFSSRLRSSTGTKKQIYLSQNPNRDCFNFHFCGDGQKGGGWFSCDTGEVFFEKNGRVRYVFIGNDGKLDGCIWGDTKDEVYQKAKFSIDQLCKEYANIDAKPFWFIKQVSFFTFLPSDNKALIENNPDYIGTVATSVVSKGMGMPNWLQCAEDDEELSQGEVSEAEIMAMFTNEPKRDWKRRIVVDFASEGKDNLTMGYFEGLHMVDLQYSQKNGYYEGIKIVRDFMAKHHLDERSLIIDTQGQTALKEAFPNALVKWSGSAASTKRSKGSYQFIKHEAADLLVLLIKNGLITIDNSLANRKYLHQRRLKEHQTIAERIIFEAKVLQFETNSIGKRALISKKDKMHKLLQSQSPDIIDLLIMAVGGSIHDCYRIINDKRATTGLNLGGMYGIFGMSNSMTNNVENVYSNHPRINNVTDKFSKRFFG